jgi:hypothetical protein
MHMIEGPDGLLHVWNGGDFACCPDWTGVIHETDERLYACGCWRQGLPEEWYSRMCLTALARAGRLNCLLCLMHWEEADEEDKGTIL